MSDKYKIRDKAKAQSPKPKTIGGELEVINEKALGISRARTACLREGSS